MGRKSASGSGIRDEQPRSYFPELRNHFFGFFEVKILKFFDADPGSGMETVRIRDKHPGSATLPIIMFPMKFFDPQCHLIPTANMSSADILVRFFAIQNIYRRPPCLLHAIY
jgi:hypothetical protein